MDTALELKTGIDNGQVFSEQQIIDKLQNSELVKGLTADLPAKSLPLVWRLICISEIPFSNRLYYTQQLIKIIYEKLATSFGFSLSGDEEMFFPCYNAMMVSALCRLGRAEDKQVQNAVEWIALHQPMQKGQKTELPGFNFNRFGGCYHNTPCYIGLAKSVFALQDYQEQTNETKYDAQLQKGIIYILEHKFFRRLSNGEPITKHITDISFPETYHLNLVELIRFAKKSNLLGHPNAEDLIAYIEKRKTKNGYWKNSFSFKAGGYITFDKGREISEWTTQIIKQSLAK